MTNIGYIFELKDRVAELEAELKDKRESLDLAEHAIRQIERERDEARGWAAIIKKVADDGERDVDSLLADQKLLLEALRLAVRHGCDHCSEEIAEARRIAAKFEI